MKKIILYIALGIIVLGLIIAGIFKYYVGPINIPTTTDPVQTLTDFTVPAGFAMSVYAANVPDARVIVIDPVGRLVVSQPEEGKVTTLIDDNNDGVAEKQIVVASGLNLPHGLAFRCTDVAHPQACQLYVAEKDALDVFDYDATTSIASNKRKLLDLPGGSIGIHFTRTLLFKAAPEQDTLLISIGSSCNVCSESNEQRAAIISYNVVTGKSELYAKGLRNSVFMTLNPVSGAVWATEMGRDRLGDELPPDEINIIEKGKNYGWPICYGANIHDTAYDKNTYIRNPCMSPFETPSFIDLPAHSAPLGIAFIPEEGWPEGYWYNAFVAYHGSWNRSTPTGYKIVRIKTDAKGKSTGIEDFITGWLKPDGTKIGRPADIKVLSGGVMYISDDTAGRIYKVSRVSE